MKQIVQRGMILYFRGEYAAFSNFYSCPVEYGGIRYTSSMAAFLAQKTQDQGERRKIAAMNARAAKQYCGPKASIKLRPDWDEIYIGVMKAVVEAKFKQNPALMEKLLGTGYVYLVEGNTQHDNDWGECFCPACSEISGSNLLGEILMEIREEARRQCSHHASTLVKLPDGSAIVAYACPCETYPSIQIYHLHNAHSIVPPVSESMMCYAELDTTKERDGLRTVAFDGRHEDPQIILPFHDATTLEA